MTTPKLTVVFDKELLDAVNALHATIKDAVAKLGTVEPAVLEAKTWEPPVVNIVMDAKSTRAALQHLIDGMHATNVSDVKVNGVRIDDLEDTTKINHEWRNRAEAAERHLTLVTCQANDEYKARVGMASKLEAAEAKLEALTATAREWKAIAGAAKEELDERRAELALVLEGSHKNTLKLVETEKLLADARIIIKQLTWQP